MRDAKAPCAKNAALLTLETLSSFATSGEDQSARTKLGQALALEMYGVVKLSACYHI